MAHSASIHNPVHPAGAVVARTRLEASRNAPALARRFIRDVLAGYGADGELLERAELLVSELVTNAVVHAGTPVRLSVSVTDGVMRIEAEDHGGGRVARRPPGDLRGASAGYGLWLVESLAQSWGVDYGGGEHRQRGRGRLDRQKAATPKAATPEAKKVWLTLPLPS